MQTVAETLTYLSDADAAGMQEADRLAVIEALAKDPMAGDLIKGSGGVRKLRVARPGGGKSGGWRVLAAYVGPNLPVYLVAAYAKSDRANISRADVNALAKLMDVLKAKGKRP